MNKTELVAAIAESTQVTKKDTEAVVNAVFDNIVNAVKKGDTAQFVGFGTFAGKKREAREGHNPATGEKIKIAACVAPVFKAGKAFKDAVN